MEGQQVYFQFWQKGNTLNRYWYVLCAVKNQIKATYKSYLKLSTVSNVNFGILEGRGRRLYKRLGLFVMWVVAPLSAIQLSMSGPKPLHWLPTNKTD